MISFNKVPVERDTQIIFQEEIVIGALIVLFQRWHWDGIEGESLIFSEYDAVDLSDSELFILTRLTMLVDKGSKMTLVRDASGYTFVNFNFS